MNIVFDESDLIEQKRYMVTGYKQQNFETNNVVEAIYLCRRYAKAQLGHTARVIKRPRQGLPSLYYNVKAVTGIKLEGRYYLEK